MDKFDPMLDDDSTDDSSVEETVGGGQMNSLPLKKKPEKEKARWTDDEVNISMVFLNSCTFFPFYPFLFSHFIRMKLFVD